MVSPIQETKLIWKELPKKYIKKKSKNTQPHNKIQEKKCIIYREIQKKKKGRVRL